MQLLNWRSYPHCVLGQSKYGYSDQQLATPEALHHETEKRCGCLMDGVYLYSRVAESSENPEDKVVVRGPKAKFGLPLAKAMS